MRDPRSALNRHGLASVIEGLLRPRSAPIRAMVTQTGPHLRDSVDLSRLRLCMMIALAPSVLMAFYNTGHQAGLAMSRLGLDSLPGWRGALLAALGLGGPISATAAAIIHGMLYVLPILGIAHVAAVCAEPWNLATRLVQLLLAPAADDDLVAALAERAREGQADAGPTARDQNRIPGELHRLSTPSSGESASFEAVPAPVTPSVFFRV